MHCVLGSSSCQHWLHLSVVSDIAVLCLVGILRFLNPGSYSALKRVLRDDQE